MRIINEINLTLFISDELDAYYHSHYTNLTMTPSFVPNSNNVNATIPVFPRNTYEFKILSFKPSKGTKENKETKVQEDRYGITVMLECISSGPMAGKKLPIYFGWAENQFAFWKRFMMAVYDFTMNDEGEQAFGQQVLLEKDENVDFDTGELGSYYRDAVGRTVVGDAEITKYNNADQNRWNWRGVSSSIPTPESVSV